MADQITKSVRNIVRGMKDDPKGLGDIEDHKSIGASRGEAFINSRGDVSSTSSSSGGADSEGGVDESPGSSAPQTTDPSSNDTGGTGGVNNGSGEPEDPAEADQGLGETLSGVTGTDPDSAKLTTVNFDSREGVEFLPPDNWDTPDGAPGAETGKSWVVASASGSYYQGADGAFAAYKATDSTANGFSLTGGTGVAAGWWGVQAYDNDMTVTRDGNPDLIAAFRIPVAHTIDSVHPSTGSCTIAYDAQAGGYKGHELDPDCSEAQKVAKAFTIVRSKSDPSKYFRYTKLADGGTKQTLVDSSGVPVPGSITKVFDESGTVTGWHDVSVDPSIK